MPVGDVFYSGQPSGEEDEYADPFCVMAGICTLRAGGIYAENRIKDACKKSLKASAEYDGYAPQSEKQM